jgi:hypothetical protein
VKFSFIHAQKASFPIGALCLPARREPTGILRVCQPASEPARRRRGAALQGDPRDLRQQGRDVQPARASRARRPRCPREQTARRAVDARHGHHAVVAAKALEDDDSGREPSGRTQRARARLHRSAVQRALRHRHHIRVDRRGLGGPTSPRSSTSPRVPSSAGRWTRRPRPGLP